MDAFSSYPLHSGRLACSLEGAGKRRLFVIGNYIKQRLLHPVHEWAAKVYALSPWMVLSIKDRPIQLLMNRPLSKVYSFDLTAATDRWPVSTIHDFMMGVFGPSMASCIVNGALALNSCSVVPPLVKKHSELVFVAGQPLGYHASWPLFALTHHYVVWLAAEEAYPGRYFRDYALLGDDIVIADQRVAEAYQRLLDKLQVSISKAKSLVSDTGHFEFAKQFWDGRIKRNLSPVSSKAVLASAGAIGLSQLAHKYILSSKTVIRMAGAGYRALSQLASKGLSHRFQRLLRVTAKPALHNPESELAFECWLTGCLIPINPYLKGMRIQMVLDRWAPSKSQTASLELPPDTQYWASGERDNQEWGLTHNWLLSQLSFLTCII